MKKSRFTEEQIVFALKQAELGTPVPEVCRKLGISDATFYTAQKYGGISPSELKHMRQLEGKPSPEEAGCRPESRQGHAAGRAGKRADAGTPARVGQDLQTRYGASERQVCFALKISRSSFRYRSVAADDSALRLRIRR